jgi:hypothetical protein
MHEELKNFKPGSFGFDLAFLRRFDSVIILQSDDNKSQVIVSPKYQGKVFTSTAEGLEGKSFGWINYKVFSAPLDAHMNAYGGENRLWLGPEGGPYSLFFTKGSEMKFENWKTPSPIDIEAWNVTKQDSSSVQLEKKMELVNYKGTLLHLTVERKVAILSKKEIASIIYFPYELPSEENASWDSVHTVGYRTNNTITNTGNSEWNKESGMPCIWILDMFTPSNSTTVIIPFDSSHPNPITSSYFGKIPAERLTTKNGILFFKADGKRRGKLGINPSAASKIAGSYDASSNILTIAIFENNQNEQYLNQEWTTTKSPFSGDAVNAYNDGPLEDGTQMGPFYEIESVSPAAFLKAGESLSHQHAVLHFTGSRSSLDRIARHVLGISLVDIPEAFSKK